MGKCSKLKMWQMLGITEDVSYKFLGKISQSNFIPPNGIDQSHGDKEFCLLCQILLSMQEYPKRVKIK